MKTMAKYALMAIVLAGCGGGDGDGDAADAAIDAPACAPVAGAPAEKVMTTGGVVRGARDGETWAYKGVPYVAPPVGAARFLPPAPVACSAAELDATRLGPRCPQLQEDGSFVGEEDCLQLNVWAPATAAAPRPVMVWIHGGGNAAGTAVDPLYDGRRLAVAGDVVVVTINYRLGQLGFLADAVLAPGGSLGNYGTLDQLAALDWVQANVAAFGGDPGNVTIFGESAGGRNVCTLLATPGSAGRFHRAIVESGACKFLDTVARAQATADDVAEALGCTGADRAACLRAAPVEAMTRAAAAPVGTLEASGFGSVVDGTVVPEQPEAAMAAGRHHAVPFIVGANADETAREVPPGLTEAQYDTLVRAQYGAIANAVLAHYPPTPTPRLAYVRLTTDARFVCPSRQIARKADAGQTAPVRRYFFSYAPNALGAVHGLEIPFVFGTFDGIVTPNGQPYQPTATDLALSSAMQGYWTRFARTGDPGGTPTWPLQGAGDPVLVLDRTITTATDVRAADCDFWAPYYDAL